MVHLYFYQLFLLAVTLGIQIVLVPWMVIDYLSLSSSYVGLVQAAILIPNLFFLLFGGGSADQGYVTEKLRYLYFLYAMTHGLFFILLLISGISLPQMLLYALTLGVLNGFLQPYKEYILKWLANNNTQKIVAKANVFQLAGQGAGVLLASYAYESFLQFLPLFQVLLLLISVVFLWQLKSYFSDFSIDATMNSNSGLDAILSGITYCLSEKKIRHIIYIVAFNGFFHIGVFLVALPILTKEIYAQSVNFYGWLQFLFVIGSITAATIVWLKEQLDMPGKRFVFSLLYSGLILLSLSAKPTLFGLMFMLYLWGVIVGISSLMGRTMIHQLVEESYRGRAISIYQLALFGAGPLGALFAGFLTEWMSILELLRYSGIASFILFGLMIVSPLWDDQVVKSS